MSKRFVVVVEDEPFLRSLIAGSLEKADFEVATAANAVEARKLFRKRDPDAAILDIDLGEGPTGLEIGEYLLAKFPGTAVVYLTMLSDPRAIDPNHGRINPRAAYLNKRRLANHEELLDALEAVLHDQDLSKFRHDLSDESPIAKMTTGQVQVLFMVARGFTNQQIADARKRSLSATEALIGRTFSALGVDPARDANARILAVREFFRQAGIVVPDVERP